MLTGCSAEESADGTVTVAASFFPLAEMTREMKASQVNVVDLTPPGVEPHDMELSSKQVDAIEDAQLVVVLPELQPAVAQAAKRAKAKTVSIETGEDPHVWLDPVAMQDVVRKIAGGLGGMATPELVLDRLRQLDGEYRTGLATCERRVVVTAHDAFSRLAERYNLEIHALAGISPEAEPDPRRLGELADLVRRTGTTTVFTEALVSPRAGEALAREAGVKTDVLDPLESGEPGTYFDVMRQNLAKLRAALSCR